MWYLWYTQKILLSPQGEYEITHSSSCILSCNSNDVIMCVHCPLWYRCEVHLMFFYRRVYLSIAAAAIYMASQASEVKKTQKGTNHLFSSAVRWNCCCNCTDRTFNETDIKVNLFNHQIAAVRNNSQDCSSNNEVKAIYMIHLCNSILWKQWCLLWSGDIISGSKCTCI